MPRASPIFKSAVQVREFGISSFHSLIHVAVGSSKDDACVVLGPRQKSITRMMAGAPARAHEDSSSPATGPPTRAVYISVQISVIVLPAS